MKIRRAAPWCHVPGSVPCDGQQTSDLPQDVKLRDIKIVRSPAGCKTLREAYDALKADGYTFLDGQVLSTLILRGKEDCVPAWNTSAVGTYSYIVFAGVLLQFNMMVARDQGFPALGWADNGETAELSMMGWGEALFDDDEDPIFFAVMRKEEQDQSQQP